MDFQILSLTINDNIKYLILILGFAAYLVVLRLLYVKIHSLLHKLTKKSKTNIDDLILEKLKKPLFYIFVLIGLLVELKILALPENIDSILTKAVVSIITVLVFILVYRIYQVLARAIIFKRLRKDKDLANFLGFLDSIVKITLFTLAFFQLLIIWGVNITPLLASAGIAGLAIALAAQQLLGNFFGGINLFLDKTIKVGDRIKFNGKYLIVEEVNIRTTKFRTLENAFYIVPNSVLANSEIENLSQPEGEPKNVRIKIGVAYGSNIDKVKEVLKRVAEENSYRLKDEPVDVYFYELGDYSLNFLVVFRVEDASKMWPAQVEYIEKVYKKLEKEGIEIPFPTQTIYCKKE
ncbi:MAG: mechanosensitive ion channel family protein [Nanoarchaeota archaeon]